MPEAQRGNAELNNNNETYQLKGQGTITSAFLRLYCDHCMLDGTVKARLLVLSGLCKVIKVTTHIRCESLLALPIPRVRSRSFASYVTSYFYYISMSKRTNRERANCIANAA